MSIERANGRGRIVATLAGALLASAFAMPAFAESPVTDDRLANADSEPQNWLTTLQNYSSHRYSRLDEINADNIGGLRVAFTIPITTAFAGRTSTNLDTSPLVDEGMMYFEDGGGVFYKVDVRDGGQGHMVWTADAAVAKDVAAATRGFALLDNLIVKCLRDGRTVAVDRETGEFVWDVQRMGIDHPGSAGVNLGAEACTGGTVAMGGHVMVSNGLGDGGTRGWLEALDPADGSELWRWYAVPGPGEPGHETWADDHNAWKTGGAGMWTQGSYDPDSRLTYWGTANPVPLFDPEFRPGDNLYTDSVVALNVDTGDLAWYFQYLPNDSWDYDEQGVHFLIEREIDGADRNIVAHFGRNGFFYQFDRGTGEFLSNAQYIEEINWTTGLDPKTGLPVEFNPDLDLQEYIPETRWLRGEGLDQNTPACPHLGGGVRWQYPAYNPDTGIAYAAANDGCFQMEVVETIALGPDGGINVEEGGGIFGFDGNWPAAARDYRGAMWAMDVNTGELIATHETEYAYLSGVSVTAGGLVLTSTVDGLVVAHDARTLEPLWQFSTGISSRGTPIVYAVDGKEYIAVLVGGDPGAGGGPDISAELAGMQRGAMLYVFTL
ncbi:MAG: PQQ-binding-like beta-propeller repeat protein [Bauldia sp.]|nr:PQQ-binding-like beta-propeller repeat protein [Bauldia sp.]